jgi:receptor expression-enhancing protein 5/6
MDEINKHFSTFPPLILLSRASGIRITFLVLGFFLLSAFFSLFNLTGNISVLITGTLYPGYMSLCSIHSKEIEDDKQWLSYWVLFAGSHFADHFLNHLIELIPFYYTLKLLFVVYLFWPTTRGSLLIYERFLFPKFLIREDDDSSVRGSNDLKSQSFKQD